MTSLLRRSRKKPKIVLDECNLAKECMKPYLGTVNATDLVPCGTPDLELLEVAKEKKMLVCTIDVNFVLKAVSHEKEIIYQNNDGVRVHLKPKIIQTDCNNRKYRCPLTFCAQENDEVVIP